MYDNIHNLHQTFLPSGRRIRVLCFILNELDLYNNKLMFISYVDMLEKNHKCLPKDFSQVTLQKSNVI